MTTFNDLGLSPATIQAVTDSGYTTPTPIQEQAIPVALAGRDVLGIAQTGTGKTAAFTLPLIDRLAAGRAKARMPRSLVIAPTRELADQVAASFDKYAKGRKLTWALLIGGVSMGDQITKLERGVDVLIATPGRLLDLFDRSKILLNGVQIMVVDEADRMLDMGFIPDIERIFKLTPAAKQTLFFSATMPPEITRLTKQFLKDPTRIEASAPATTASTIAQHIVRVPTSDPKAKQAALRALLERADVRNGIVFCNRKSEVDVVAKSLKAHGFDAAAIHGDLDQSVRTRTLESFRSGELKLLCASDVAARGLDIPDVSHVFNFDVPHHADDYVHRIGRTGRAGKKGDTYMLVTPADEKNVDKVTKLIGMAPDEVTLDIDWSNFSGSGGRSGAARAPAGRDRTPAREEAPARAPRERGRRSAKEAPAPEVAVEAAAVTEAPVEAADAAVETRDAPRRERRPRRRSEGRNDSASESRSETVSAPVDEPAIEAQSRPGSEPQEAARSESHDEPRSSGRGRSRNERGDRGSRAEPSRQGARNADDGWEREPAGVVGFGDELPAFLRR